MLILRSHRLAKFLTGVAPWEHLRSRYAYPTGVNFNPFLGYATGTVLNHAEPSWGDVVTLDDPNDSAQYRTSIQNAVTNAAASQSVNTKFLIAPGADRVAGRIVMSANASDKWIGLYSAANASLPATDVGSYRGTKDNRIKPAHHADMPEWSCTTNNEGCLDIRTGAKKLYVRGIRLNNKAHTQQDGGIVTIANTGSQTTSSDYPEDIILNGCTWDGGDDAITYQKTRRAIAFSGKRLAVVNSTMDNMGQIDADCQNIFIATGEGPLKIANNDMCADGQSENIIQGGFGYPGGVNTWIMRNLEISGNHIWKRATWGNNKPHIEFKVSMGAWIDGNIIHGHNGLGQPYSIEIWVTGQYGTNEQVVSQYVILSNNWIYQVPTGIVHANHNYDNFDPSLFLEVNHCATLNNLLHDLGDANFPGAGLVTAGAKLDELDYLYNTVIGSQTSNDPRCLESIAYNGAYKQTNTRVKRNVFASRFDAAYLNESPYIHSTSGGSGRGQVRFDSVFGGGSEFAENMVHNPLDEYDRQIRTGNSAAAMGFTDFAGKNFELLNTSPGYQAYNGVSVGVQYPVFRELMARVL